MAGMDSFNFTKEQPMEVRWKPGTHHKVDSDKAHAAIEVVRRKCGGSASAAEVVEAAKAKRNPLHPEFEWDDSIAATEHRLNQARELMRHLVVVRDDVTTDRPQRVYQVVRQPQEDSTSGERIKHVYRTTEDVMADPDMRAEVLGRALRELISIRTRYRDLQELAVVLRAIDEVVESGSA
jgi:hypothetical protein